MTLICIGLIKIGNAQTTIVSNYADGDGTADNPYQISNVYELDLLSRSTDDWASHFILINDIDASETETWNNGTGFHPIGDFTSGSRQQIPFSGNFDGQGYSIKNLFINREDNYVGLFGCTQKANILNLRLENATITGQESTGGIVGRMFSGYMLENCHVTGTVTGTDAVGAIAGSFSGSMMETDDYINLCSAQATISGNILVGGIVGTLSAYTKMENSVAECTISGTEKVGGLAGTLAGYSGIHYSYSNSTIKATSSAGGAIGLTAGSTSAKNCFAYGVIEGESTIGGFGGSISDCNIENCYSATAVTGTEETGAFIGFFEDDSKITSSFFIPALNSIETGIGKNNSATSATALSDEQISDELSYDTWDFETIWTFAYFEGETQKRPVFTAFLGNLFAGGEGTTESPYQIETLKQLRNLSENNSLWDKHYILIADIDATDTKNWNPVDGEPVGFIPIGKWQSFFTGSFDGKNHTISNLYINRNAYDTGLFGYITNATITNVNLVNVDITGNIDVGSICGTVYDLNGPCTVSHISATGIVKGNKLVGGIVGKHASAPTSNGHITECFANITIEATVEEAGAIVGHNSGTVTNCYAFGSVKGENNVGGLCGYNYQTIENSFCFSTVEGTTGVGAFTGVNESTISNCYFNSSINEGIDAIGTDLNDLTITDLTFEQFSDKANFTNWGFISEDKENPWTMGVISEEYPTPHPCLKRQAKQFFKGEGTEEVPYEIATLNDLRLLSENHTVWDKHFIQTADIDATDTKDWNNGAGFTPIGNKTSSTDPFSFSGHYNGQDYTISNLFIDNSENSEVYTGLFGYIDENSSVIGINIDKATFTGDKIGTIVGQSKGNVKNCSVTNTNISAKYGAGGIICNNQGTIDSCSVTNIEITGSTIGGIMNSNYGTATNLTVSNSTITSTNCAGGIVYSSSAFLNNCTATDCSITGKNYVGGIAGISRSFISNSSVTAQISGNNYIGGIAGSLTLTDEMNFPENIEDQENKFNWTNCEITGNEYVGGLYGSTSLPSLHPTCEYTRYSFTTGTVTGTSYVGGLVGDNYSKSCFSECYTTATITGETNTGIISGDNYAGTYFRVYYDSDKAGDIPTLGSDPTASIATGLTTEEFADKSKLEGFQFGKVWTLAIDEAIDEATRPYFIKDYGPKFSGGDGSYKNPFLISNLDDLRALSESEDIWRGNYNFMQTADIDATDTKNWNEGKGFNPIGELYNYVENQYPFTGRYTGQGHSISNLTINRPDENYVGLFGAAQGFIDSLHLKKVSVEGKNYCGGMFGLHSGNFKNLSVQGTVTGNDTIGGIAGKTDKYPAPGTMYGYVDNSFSDVIVTGNNYVGGISGYSGSKFTQCYSTSSVTGKRHVGGIAGYGVFAFNNCFVAGEVTGNECVGGVIGTVQFVYSSQNIYVTTSISGKSDKGAIVGDNMSSTTIENNGYYFDSEYTGETRAGGGIGPSVYATELNTIDFQDATNFPEFDFDEVWKISLHGEVDNNIRPYFQWMDDYFYVDFSAGKNGSIEGEMIQIIKLGEDAETVTATPDYGYHFVGWEGIDATTPEVTVTAIDKHTKALANFAINEYAVVFKAPENGTIKGESEQTVTHGTDASLIIAIPDEGYKFKEWQNNAGLALPFDDNVLLENIISDTTLTAIFQKLQYTASFTADENGSVEGIAKQTVNHGENSTTVIALANEGHEFIGWYENDELITSATELIVEGITEDRNILAVFKAKQFTATFTSETDGVLEGTLEQTLNYGEQTSIVTAIPNEGFDFLQWQSINEITVSDQAAIQLTVISDTALVAHYKVAEHSVEFIAGENGTIEGEKLQTVNHNDNTVEVKATPAAGSEFVGWYNDAGSVISTTTTLIVENVISDLQYTAVFATKDHSVTFYSNEFGKVDGTALQYVKHGESATEVEAVPAEGATFISWQDKNGKTVSGKMLLTLSDIISDTVITAIFAQNEYEITVNAENGSVALSKDIVKYGEDVSLAVAPAEGYELESIAINGNDVTADVINNLLVITSVTSDIVIDAQFKEKTNEEVSLFTFVQETGKLTVTATEAVTITIYNAEGVVYEESIAEINQTFDIDISSFDPTAYIIVAKSETKEETKNFTVEKSSFAVSFIANGNGSITGLVNQDIAPSANTEAVTAVANEGYHFVSWQTVDGTILSTGTEYIVENVTKDISIYAHFAPNAQTITIAETANGSITTETIDAVFGQELVFTITPEELYEISSLQINGIDILETVTENTFTVTITEDISIEAVFSEIGEELALTIPNASDSDVLEVVVNKPATISIVDLWGETVITQEIETIDQSTILDISALDPGKYVVVAQSGDDKIMMNHLVLAKIFNVVIEQVENGIVNGTISQEITEGTASEAVEAVADEGYHFVAWVDAENNEFSTQNPLTIATVEKDYSLKPLFAINEYNIDISFNSSTGSVTADTETITHGESVTISIAPEEGYILDVILINEENLSSSVTDNQIVVDNIEGELEVEVYFKETIIATETAKMTVEIYPTPASEFIYITGQGIAHVTLLNSNMTMVAKEQGINANKISIETAHLPAGLYFIQIETAVKTIYKEVIIK